MTERAGGLRSEGTANIYADALKLPALYSL